VTVWIPLLVASISGIASVVAIIIVVRSTKPKVAAETRDTVASTVISLGRRVATLEKDQQLCHAEKRKLQNEIHQLTQWGSVLIEQLVKAEVVPMTYDEFKKGNGYA